MGTEDHDADLPGLLPDLLAELPLALDDVQDVLADHWPDYAEFLRTQRGEVLAAGRFALGRVLELATEAGDGPHPLPGGRPSDDLGLFRELGRAQWRSGDGLTDLLGAYQAGARAAWRRLSRTVIARGEPGEAVALLAEAVFVLVDQLSRASTVGYVEEQSTAGAERERARSELAHLLLTDGSSARAIATTAERARWAVPERASVVLLEVDNPVTTDIVSRLSERSLLVPFVDAVGIVLSAAPDVTRSRLQHELRGSHAVVGPSVPLAALPASLRVSEVVAHLQRVDVLSEDPLFVDDHLDAVIVHRDSRLLEILRTRVLAPLDPLAPEARQRLEETLRSWLWHLGDRQAVAAELFIHRQTVRYRLAQLQTLFDGALDDPAVRARLMLALAWQPVTPSAGAPAARSSPVPAPPGQGDPAWPAAD